VTRRMVLDDESEFALWKSDRYACENTCPKVVIAHQDRPIGTSLCRLLSMKGYQTVYAYDIAAARAYLKCWEPEALLFDTRLDARSDYRFVRDARAEMWTAALLMVALSNIWPLDSIPALRKAGFDGHCRRPCSLWRLSELLDTYFDRCSQ